MRLLIDECLSDELVHEATGRGYQDATHVRWIGKGGWKDWSLIDVIVDGGYTFVTQNAVDFRGSAADRGAKGEHARVALHAGLICLNCAEGLTLDVQLELFRMALDEIEGDGDLYNRALEVTLFSMTEEVQVDRYPIPRNGPYAR